MQFDAAWHNRRTSKSIYGHTVEVQCNAMGRGLWKKASVIIRVSFSAVGRGTPC